MCFADWATLFSRPSGITGANWRACGAVLTFVSCSGDFTFCCIGWGSTVRCLICGAAVVCCIGLYACAVMGFAGRSVCGIATGCAPVTGCAIFCVLLFATGLNVGVS